MRNQRIFSLEFKRQVVEELLSSENRPTHLCHRYDITSSVLSHRKKQYSRGKFNNEPTKEGALRDRVEELEWLMGKLALENEFLKKAAGHLTIGGFDSHALPPLFWLFTK